MKNDDDSNDLKTTMSPDSTPEPKAAANDANSPLPQLQNSIQPSNQVQQNSEVASPSPAKQKSKISKKSFKLAIVVGLVVALLGVIAYYFLIYVPSKPENVFSTTLERTGQGLSKIVEETSDEKTRNKLTASEITGQLTGDLGGGKISGTLGSKYDNNKIDAKLDVIYTPDGAKDQKYSLSYISELTDAATFPNIFLRIEGFKNLDLDSLLPGITKFDGKWVLIEDTYVEKITNQYKGILGNTSVEPTDKESRTKSISAEEYAEVAKVFTDITRDHVFSADPARSVLVNKQFVGKETVDGQKTYHYLVGISKENFATYCKALSSGIVRTQAYKKVIGATDQATQNIEKAANQQCDQMKASIDENDSYDLWVDSKTKLIYKIRFAEQMSKENYIEFGQRYKGGDDIQLFMNIFSKSDEFKGSVSLDFNFDTAVSKLVVDFNSNGEDKWNINLSAEAKPITNEFKLEKPTDAVKLQDVAKELGMDLDAILSPKAANQSLNNMQTMPMNDPGLNALDDQELVAN